jgi:molybdenum cofactor biosynthesis enzyme MoaA
MDAFKNISLMTKAGELYVSPCCQSSPKKIEKIDFFNDPYLRHVRSSFLQNQWPQECRSCSVPESQGKSSRRIDSNKWYDDNEINDINEDFIRLDYWVGDICNLACVMCGPENSSLWKQELQIPIQQRRISRNKVWKDIDITKLRYVHFHGGEPLLSKDHEEFLAAIPNKASVHIYYNTNGTVRADQDLMDLWNQFKLVQIDFSIDDIDERFNYIRFPANWEKVRDNLLWFRDQCPGNCMFNIMTVISVLNQPYLDYLSHWIQKNFSTNRFTDPVEHRFQAAYGSLATDNQNKHKILDYLSQIDRRRGTDWKTIFPDSYNTLLSQIRFLDNQK